MIHLKRIGVGLLAFLPIVVLFGILSGVTYLFGFAVTLVVIGVGLVLMLAHATGEMILREYYND